LLKYPLKIKSNASRSTKNPYILLTFFDGRLIVIFAPTQRASIEPGNSIVPTDRTEYDTGSDTDGSLTTLKDINWTPPQPVQDKVKETFESKSGNGEYKTTYNPNNNTYKCNCFGFYRAKDRQCKHIKALKEKMSNV
jgi:hypothetical protein